MQSHHTHCVWKNWILSVVLFVVASNTELVEKLEELLVVWSKQIEQVLAESEQMRREADDIGPTAELAYWKSRMAKFNKWGLSWVLPNLLPSKKLGINSHFDNTYCTYHECILFLLILN